MIREGEPSPADFSIPVRASFLGLPVRWREIPFEWVRERYLKGIREFEAGPFVRFEGGFELAAAGGGSLLTFFSDFHPRGALGHFLACYFVNPRALSQATALVRRMEASLRADGAQPFPVQRTRTPTDPLALDQGAARLRQAPVERDIVGKFLDLLGKGYDDELFRMRPFELADRWGADRLKSLAVFLHSVKAGLLDMSWEVLCPNCSAPKKLVASLSELEGSAHCATCEIRYGVNFDDSVELRFTVHPSIRPAKDAVFCVGSPAHTPFAVAQLHVPQGAPRSVEMDLEPESYVLRDLRAKSSVILRPAKGDSGDGPIRLDLGGLPSSEVRFKPGKVTLDLRGRSDGPALVRLEREGWRERGARASVVTAFQQFRDLFSTEVLSPGVEIAVRNVALLFSDLKGSTAMYEHIGDSTAYAVVRDHFNYLFEIIARRRGAVIKTIGDAVMAAFYSGADAMEAALEMQERIGDLTERLKPKPPVVLKLGVHQGSTIAITSNGVLDYFGTSVNVAARMQNESHGGDIVITEPMHSDEAVRAVLERHGPRVETFEIQLKGLSDSFKLWRLTP